MSGDNKAAKRQLPASEERERYRAALQLLEIESGRLFRVSSSFLVAVALLGGFLLNALNRTQRDGWLVIAGAIVGIVVTTLWWIAYRKNTASFNLRRDQAHDAEPAGWDLIGGPGRRFAKGDCVEIAGNEHRMPYYRLTMRWVWGLLVFAAGVGFATVIVVAALD